MTQGTGERIYRACARCRHRKVKCDLRSIGERGKPPCVKCHDEGFHCVLAGSRRGGDYSRNCQRSPKAPREEPRRRSRLDQSNRIAGNNTPRSEPHGALRRGNHENVGGIQNPLQALELLARVAAKENNGSIDDGDGIEKAFDGGRVHDEDTVPNIELDSYVYENTSWLLQWAGVQVTDVRTLGTLLESYHDTYHTFLPLVPRYLLLSRDIARSVREEPFLMTTIFLITTKERPEYVAIHKKMWETIQKMLLQVVLGATEVRTVGSVEGLLILAEWVPHANAPLEPSNISQKGSGELAGTEDTAAWTLVGLAVRQAYLLHLDKYAFRGDSPEDGSSSLSRKRLAWTYTYVADRQISIRMGQAFWCRGPSLATKFTASDFPTLQPLNAYEDDYASVLQSQLELTVLYGNIHDLLYGSKPQSVALMLRGDYTKYLDDSMQGLAAWKQTWSNLDTSPHLKLILDLQYEYLRLYVHGFAFQAAISRTPGTPPNHAGERPISRFPHGLLATPDGRHIRLAICAAKSVLDMLGHRINPTRHLRYCGPRYYLYAIHCAVFLFKAASYGAIGSEERDECVKIVGRYIENLDVAASCKEHIAYRHSKLLASLWSTTECHVAPDSFVSNIPSNTTGHLDPKPASSVIAEPSVDFTSQFDFGHHPDPCVDDAGTATFQAARESRPLVRAPESLVTGLYSSDQRCTDFDMLGFLDFGAYSELDLRNLISI